MSERPSATSLDYTPGQDAYAEGYRRGYDVATSRAVSRQRLGLDVESDQDTTE